MLSSSPFPRIPSALAGARAICRGRRSSRSSSTSSRAPPRSSCLSESPSRRRGACLAALESAREDHGGDAATGILLDAGRSSRTARQRWPAARQGRGRGGGVRFTQSIRSALRRCRFPSSRSPTAASPAPWRLAFLASPCSHLHVAAGMPWTAAGVVRSPRPARWSTCSRRGVRGGTPHCTGNRSRRARPPRARHDRDASRARAPREALPDLRAELPSSRRGLFRCADRAPLRRGGAAASSRPLYAAEKAAPLHGALYAAFGPHVKSVAAAVERLDAQRRIARDHAAQLANEALRNPHPPANGRTRYGTRSMRALLPQHELPIRAGGDVRCVSDSHRGAARAFSRAAQHPVEAARV